MNAVHTMIFTIAVFFIVLLEEVSLNINIIHYEFDKFFEF